MIFENEPMATRDRGNPAEMPADYPLPPVEDLYPTRPATAELLVRLTDPQIDKFMAAVMDDHPLTDSARLAGVLNQFGHDVHRWAMAKGFHPTCELCAGSGLAEPLSEPCDRCEGLGSYTPPARRLDAGMRMIALAHSELSEAVEVLRRADPFRLNIEPVSPKLPGVPALAEELADVVIRVADTAEALGLDLGEAVVAKMRFNASRPVRHGKNF